MGVVNENKVKILKIEEIEFEAKKHLVLGSETLVEPELMSRELLLSWKNTYLFFVLTKTVQHMSESSIRQFIEKYYPKYYSTETYPASECVRIHKITEPWSPNKHQWRYQGSCRCHQRWAWQAAKWHVNKTYTYYMQQLNKLIIENKALQNENEALKAENAKVKQHISQLDENAVRWVTVQKDAVIESLNTQLASKNEDIAMRGDL